MHLGLQDPSRLGFVSTTWDGHYFCLMITEQASDSDNPVTIV
jgi:hypothetical protein